MTITYKPGASTANTVAPRADAVASAGKGRVPDRMPLFVSADQVYYWSFVWQSDIEESMAALRAGDYADFDSDDPNDVVRWLLSEED